MLNSVKAILLGCPGSGKGTLGKEISKFLSIPILSTGKLLRKLFASKEQNGNKINGGALLEDDKMMHILQETLVKTEYTNGVILDGYPRTITQAELLDNEIKKKDDTIILDIAVKPEIAIKRIVGRFMCSQCDSIYNLFFKLPYINNIILTQDITVKDLLSSNNSSCKCDHCGSETFYSREDDTEEIALKRYKEYVKNTLPLTDYYKHRKFYFHFDGNNSSQHLFDEVKNVLHAKKDN
ncbi:Adenylate kinase [Candidatus Fokinia solitaria]|uniref:Adenylate kinase n=1 Tax=Candidatus Fokinia solitaria TaxID=1802984 RepID=A0A2U8BT16_9RICK|nr:nucleoside monophosphate kinase [Candidatus Fokinia solitaria]AWD33499.1 Adenylate kinase [Candidatus Fokinia solitaria]